MTLAFLNIGTQEMILIVIVMLLLFGGKKLPELARGLGRGIREFKDASEGIKKEISDQINNFEKDLDVTVEDKPKATTTVDATPAEPTIEEVETKDEVASVEEETEPVKEKKFPTFTAPANTFEHNPGGHPADETEHYKYGYSDHFAEEETKPADQPQVVEGERIEDKPSDSKLA